MSIITRSRRLYLALTVLLTVLMPATAFADNVSLQVDDSYDEGRVERHYVNMPHSGSNTLTLDGSVTSFKIYDDNGGKPGQYYGFNSNGKLLVNAPAGYVLRITGFMSVTYYDHLKVYDGASESANALVEMADLRTDVATSIGHHLTSGRNMLVHFWTDGTGAHDGINLTVELVPSTEEHQITVKSVEGCTVTPSKTSAKAGEVITLTFTEDLGCTLAGVRVHSEPRNLLETVSMRSEATWYNPYNTISFSMPNTDATVVPVVMHDWTKTAEDGCYIDMPTSGTRRVYLPFNVASASIYDDGGGGDAFKARFDLTYNNNYSRCCDSFLQLEAPEGYVMRLTGTMTTTYGDYLTVYDGHSQSSTILADKMGFGSGTADVGTIVSSGNTMMLYFRSNDNPAGTGLDLKLEVFQPIIFDGNGTAEDPYLIHNADDWTRFCHALDDNETWDRFNNKHVKLCDNITIGTMAGSSGHDFMGTFDGAGHTITLNCYDVSDDYAAVFRNVEGPTTTIKNLNVNGSIYTSANYAAGLIGNQYGTTLIDSCTVDVTIDGQAYNAQYVAQAHGNVTISASTAKGHILARGKYAAGFVAHALGHVQITNCVSNGFIDVLFNGDGTHGGFVGLTSSSSVVDIEGCLFNGYFVANGTHSCAGFVGWSNNQLNISNSLFAPQTNGFLADSSATFSRNNITSLTNSYYTETLGEPQGKMTRAIAGGDNVTVENAGTPTTYGISGITSYGTGILYNGTLYAGADDQVQLNLAYTGTDEIGGFAASAGTLTGSGNRYLLTMPDQDVTISTTEPVISLRGDINSDGSVDVIDVNILVNIILGKDNAENYAGFTDLSGDDSFDVGDVNTLVNIVLGKN